MMNNLPGTRAHRAGNMAIVDGLGALVLLASAALGGCAAEAIESTTAPEQASGAALARSAAPDPSSPSSPSSSLDSTDLRVSGLETAAMEMDRSASSASGPLAARAGGLTVTLEPTAVPELRAGGRVWVLTGRSSHSLSEAASFVPDDAFGDTTLLDGHSFEIALRDGHEINTMLSGMPLFLHLRTRHGGPDQVTASIAIAPRFSRFEGSRAVRFDAAIAPVFFLDDVSNLRYRATVRTTGAARRLTLITAEDSAPELVAAGPRAWVFDWTFERLALAADPPGDPIVARADFARHRETKQAVIEFAIRALGLTTGSPEVVWPSPGCRVDVARCVAALPPGTVDFAACGTYRQVAICRWTSPE